MNKEISPAEASNLLQNNPKTVFLDVREDSELEICRIEGAMHIPMGQVAERLEALPKEPPMVIFCHHGMRSMHVLQYLEAKGFENAVNLKGGIHAWATDIDPKMTKY